MVEEGVGSGDRAPHRGLRGPRRPLAAPRNMSVVGKALWSVERAGKGWRFEQPIGVDCSSPEPRCIWLTSLRNDNADLAHRYRAGAALPRQKRRSHPQLETRHMVRDASARPGHHT